MLLTFEQYQKISSKVSEESNFAPLERDAEDLINSVTNFYYAKNDIEEDQDKYRVNMFRRALALQIDYTNSIGASTSYEMAEKDVKSVSVDGTSVTTGKSAVDDSKGGIYKLALSYLAEVGLLYSGVQHIDRRW